MIGSRLLGGVGVLLGLVLIWGGPEMAGRVVNQWWGHPRSQATHLLARVFGWWIRFVGLAFAVVGLAYVFAPRWAAHG
jgi:hypothetical protein